MPHMHRKSQLSTFTVKFHIILFCYTTPSSFLVFHKVSQELEELEGQEHMGKALENSSVM